MQKTIIAAFYQFTPLPQFQELQPRLKALCTELEIKGTLLLAEEGINGTVAGPRASIDTLKDSLETLFKNLEYKESWAKTLPFHRLKVRLKKEIVTLGAPHIHPYEQTGTYVDPQEWNHVLANPDILVLDTRNTYEIEIGSFEGALNPQTRCFTEFPEFSKNLDKKKPIAMFCTGGIRCEKASSYLLSQGFEKVYQLKGGILKYLEDVSPEKSLWKGECFVFDGRVAVSHGLNLGHYESCHGCRHPLSEEDLWSPLYERGVSCSYCYDTLTPEKKSSARERQRQENLAKRRGTKHIGAIMKSKALIPHSSIRLP